MINTLSRASSLFLAAFLATAFAAPIGSGQPPGEKGPASRIKGAVPYSTAFPDLEPPTRQADVITNPDGTTTVVVAEAGVVPLPAVPAPAADAPPLRRVRFEQVQEGSDYLNLLKTSIQAGGYRYQEFGEHVLMATEFYRAAAELENEPVKRVPWYEARVRKFKEYEGLVRIRVEIGTDPPQRLDVMRLYRFGAEAELLELKARLEQPGGKLARPPAPQKGAPVRLEAGVAYTAFPDLKPPAESTGDVPHPPVPIPTAADPPLRKVRTEQVRKGLAYLAHVKNQNPADSYPSAPFCEYLIITTETYRLAADLEEEPAKRVPWYEARVRALKAFERFIQQRVKNQTDPQQRLSAVRFHRLQTEADLLGLKADLAAAKDARPGAGPPAKNPNPARPNAGGEPVPGSVPRGADDPGRYTAFPDLKPPTIEKAEVKFPDGTTARGLEETNGVPLPAVPEPATAAPPLRQVRFAQVQEGSMYLERIKVRMNIGAFDWNMLREAQAVTADTYRFAAELEEAPAKRVPWYEARVRKLKAFEELVRSRVGSKDEPPHHLDLAGFHRLQAEADLLKLKAEVEKTGSK